MGRWEGSGAGEEQPVLGLGGAAASGWWEVGSWKEFQVWAGCRATSLSSEAPKRGVNQGRQTGRRFQKQGLHLVSVPQF